VEETHDITRPVIRGFRGYRKWIREIEPEGFVKDLFYSIFYIINVKLILILFRFRRKYMVFAGIKPQD
jgi:hypothetical protein